MSGTTEAETPAPEAAGPRFPLDRPCRVRRRLLIMAAGAAFAALAQFLPSFPGFVERAYTEHLGQWAGRTLSAVTRWYPWSVMELAVMVLALWLLWSMGRALGQVLRGKRRLRNLLACGLLRGGALTGVVLFLFYAAWGFNYARADLITRMNWGQWAESPEESAAVEELERLCGELVDATNRAYERAMGSPDAGGPSSPPQTMAEVDRAIDEAYGVVAQKLGLHPSFAAPRGPAKPVLCSFVMSRLLISGVYTPWTGEANYNREIPACNQPEVIAHEKAHQRGVTSEDEANFFGALACITGTNPYLNYSGLLMIQRQLLGELNRRAPERAKPLIEKRHPGIARDIRAANDFYNAHAGKASEVQGKLNNLYLKANNVKGGIQSYRRSALLLLAYARRNGGTFLE